MINWWFWVPVVWISIGSFLWKGLFLRAQRRGVTYNAGAWSWYLVAALPMLFNSGFPFGHEIGSIWLAASRWLRGVGCWRTWQETIREDVIAGFKINGLKTLPGSTAEFLQRSVCTLSVGNCTLCSTTGTSNRHSNFWQLVQASGGDTVMSYITGPQCYEQVRAHISRAKPAWLSSFWKFAMQFGSLS